MYYYHKRLNHTVQMQQQNTATLSQTYKLLYYISQTTNQHYHKHKQINFIKHFVKRKDSIQLRRQCAGA